MVFVSSISFSASYIPVCMQVKSHTVLHGIKESSLQLTVSLHTMRASMSLLFCGFFLHLNPYKTFFESLVSTENSLVSIDLCIPFTQLFLSLKGKISLVLVFSDLSPCELCHVRDTGLSFQFYLQSYIQRQLERQS